MNIVFGDYSLPYQKHSYTSKLAAERIEPKAGTQRAEILRLFRRGIVTPLGWTDEELQEWTGMNPSTQRPRRIELVKQGWIKDSGRTRATSSGAQATVWVLREDN